MDGGGVSASNKWSAVPAPSRRRRSRRGRGTGRRCFLLVLVSSRSGGPLFLRGKGSRVPWIGWHGGGVGCSRGSFVPPVSPASLRRVLRRWWETGWICTGDLRRRWTSVARARSCCRDSDGMLVDDLVLLGRRWRPVLGPMGSVALPCAFIGQDPVDCGGWLQASTLEALSPSGAVVVCFLLRRRSCWCEGCVANEWVVMQCSSASRFPVFRRCWLVWRAFVALFVPFTMLIICNFRFSKKKKKKREHVVGLHVGYCQYLQPGLLRDTLERNNKSLFKRCQKNKNQSINTTVVQTARFDKICILQGVP